MLFGPEYAVKFLEGVTTYIECLTIVRVLSLK